MATNKLAKQTLNTHLETNDKGQRLDFDFFFFFFFLRMCTVGPVQEANIIFCFSSGSHALFMRPTSTLFRKKNFKTGSHDTIHTFKNYFVTVFSVFSKISGIQTHPKEYFLSLKFFPYNLNTLAIYVLFIYLFILVLYFLLIPSQFVCPV